MITEQDSHNAILKLRIVIENIADQAEFCKTIGLDEDDYETTLLALLLQLLVQGDTLQVLAMAYASGVLTERERQRREGDFL